MSVDFLLEIGVEEVPDWMIRPALADLQERFSKLLVEQNLGGSVTRMDATPRRLVLFASGLHEAQPDEVKTMSGPPVSSGQGAAQGFAKKNGVGLSDLQVVETPKGSYYSYDRKLIGRRSAEILSEALPQLIPQIYFPKTMYWTGKSGPRFIRPIRWIVALLGDTVVNFELAGVHSGSITSGHRILGSAKVPVTIENYERSLLENGVMLSASDRKARIEAGLGANVQRDEALLDTLVYLTEMPSIVRGNFDPKFLELPAEILSTVMRHHQRYFSVADSSGKLLPEFVAVMNIDSDPDGLVRTGNERVLRARFNDGRFFWDVDLKRSLAERVEDLRNVTFQAKLGSYHEKTTRVVKLAEELATKVGASSESCARAAHLAKCDLITEMVKEFTELQGVVGGLYAREQGEPEEVWKAIYDQYKPGSMEDSIPSTLAGQVLALADKVDTLRGCFAIDLIPTGSRDPFALRRAAQGVVKILVEGKLPLQISDLTAGDPKLRDFLLDRTRYYFKDVRGFAYDEVNAVLASSSENLADVEQRLLAVQSVRPTENFEPLAASFKRIQNIVKQAGSNGSATIDTALLEAGAEAELHDEFVRLRTTVAAQRESRNYLGALQSIATLRPRIDLFFDKVLVNAPDQAVRRNRLQLLNQLLSEFSTIADFSEIVPKELH